MTNQVSNIEWMTKRYENAKVEEFHNIKLMTGTNKNGKPVLAVWKGRQSNPFSHYFYNSVEQRDQAIESAKTRELEHVEYDRKKKEEKKNLGTPDFKVGDIFHESWGYDQTNVNFYEVVEKASAHYAIVREICQNQVPGSQGFDCCNVRPAPGEYLNDDTMRVKIQFQSWSSEKTLYFKSRSFSSATIIKDPENYTTYKSWYA